MSAKLWNFHCKTNYIGPRISHGGQYLYRFLSDKHWNFCHEEPSRNCTKLMQLWQFSPVRDISREPWSQAPTKSSDSHEIFVVIHAVLVRIWLQRYFRTFCSMKEFFLSHTTCRKYFCPVLTKLALDLHVKKLCVYEWCALYFRSFFCNKFSRLLIG